MPFGRVYLDSNIIISFVKADGDVEVARLLVDMVDAVKPTGTPPFATSELTLTETMVRALREGAIDDARTFDNMIVSSTWLTVGEVNRTVLLSAASARAKYPHLKLPDAVHIATAVHLGCSHILTADTGIRGEYTLEPRAWAPNPASPPVGVCRPDVATLREIIAWLDQRLP